jgi:hypothetical protein
MSAPPTPKKKLQALLPGATPPVAPPSTKRSATTPAQDPLTSTPITTPVMTALELEESFEVCRGLLRCTKCGAKGSYNKNADRYGVRRVKCKECNGGCTLTSLAPKMLAIEKYGEIISGDEDSEDEEMTIPVSAPTTQQSDILSSLLDLSPLSAEKLDSEWGSAPNLEPINYDAESHSAPIEEPFQPAKARKGKKRAALQDPDQSMVIDQAGSSGTNPEADRLRQENAMLRKEMAGLQAQLTAVTKALEGLQKSFDQQSSLLREKLMPEAPGQSARAKGKAPARAPNHNISAPVPTTSHALPVPKGLTGPTETPTPVTPTPKLVKETVSYAKMAAKPRPSIQERAKAMRPDAAGDELAAVALSMSRLHVVRSMRGPMEKKHGLCRVYADGFPQMAISELKGHFKTLHFVISKIRNIAYVSRSTIEFLVQPDYLARFKRDLKKGGWKILDKYDPSVPINKEVPEDIKNRITSAFHHRLIRLATTGSREDVKAFFANWATSLSLPLTTARVTEVDTEMTDGALGNQVSSTV